MSAEPHWGASLVPIAGDGATVRPSRHLVLQSAALAGFVASLVAMIVLGRLLPLLDDDVASYLEIAIVSALSALVIVLLPSSRSRAWLKVKIAKHLFAHRYDYRAEWLRFSGTVGGVGGDATPLGARAAKALADITCSPGALLLLPGDDGGLVPGPGWTWRGADAPGHSGDRLFVDHLLVTGRVMAFDRLRAGLDPGEAALVPAWALADPVAWAAVPLIHVGRIEGVVLLARPRIDRRLDWEDFDLLKVAGRQLASHLAEARSEQALGEARRFDEFNRRFAFIIHDIKNLVSQLALVARNAERHADNPAFRADMIATLNASAERMQDLLARLALHHRPRIEEPRPMSLGRIAAQVAETRHRQHPIRVEVDPCLAVRGDPKRLEQALGHLLQNAIEASAAGAAVTLRTERRGADAALVIEDQGCGMEAEFIRTRLFAPFASTKEGGFGIGACEVRQLVQSMGGRLEVESRAGEGSRFSILLPALDWPDAERRQERR